MVQVPPKRDFCEAVTLNPIRSLNLDAPLTARISRVKYRVRKAQLHPSRSGSVELNCKPSTQLH